MLLRLLFLIFDVFLVPLELVPLLTVLLLILDLGVELSLGLLAVFLLELDGFEKLLLLVLVWPPLMVPLCGVGLLAAGREAFGLDIDLPPALEAP
jgi:hypothetical protein